MNYSCFNLEIKDKVAHVNMCRPDEFNSMNKAFWSELPHLIDAISNDASAQPDTSASVAPSKRKLKLKLKNFFITILFHLMLRPAHLEPAKPLSVEKFLKLQKGTE